MSKPHAVSEDVIVSIANRIGIPKTRGEYIAFAIELFKAASTPQSEILAHFGLPTIEECARKWVDMHFADYKGPLSKELAESLGTNERV